MWNNAFMNYLSKLLYARLPILSHRAQGLWTFAIKPSVRSGWLILLLGLKVNALAADLRVEGRLRSSTSDGKLLLASTFVVETSGCTWRIRLTPESESRERSVVQYWEQVFDGQLVYKFAPLANPDPEAANTSIGVIERNDVPIEHSDDIVCLWLAYASGCHLKTNLNHQLKPAFYLGHPSLRWKPESLRTTIEFLGPDQWLPKQMEIYDGPLSYTTGANTELQISRRPPPFDQGSLRWLFTVSATTNFNGKEWPSAFALHSYLPQSGAKKATEIREVLRREGSIEKIHLREGLDPIRPPGLDRAVYTDDRRFVQAVPRAELLTYVNTNGDWLPENDPKLQELYRLQAKVELSQPGSHLPLQHRRTIAWMTGLLTSLAVLGSIFLLWKRRERMGSAE